MFMTMYQYLTTTFDHLSTSLRNRSQRGQVAAEYLGMVVVIAVIVVGLKQAGIGAAIGNAVKTAVSAIH
jgi:hypothetical protein